MNLKSKFALVAGQPSLALGAIWPATKMSMGGAVVGLTFGTLLPIDWLTYGVLPLGGTTLLTMGCAGFFGGWGFFDHVEKEAEKRQTASVTAPAPMPAPAPAPTPKH